MPANLSTKSQRAYQLIREGLDNGSFSPGDRLTEAKVARKLGFGRVPVRESLLRLEAEGLLKAPGPGGGRYVEFIEDKKPEDVMHRYSLREAIAGMVARLAAMNMDGWKINRLREYVQERDKWLGAGDMERASKAASELHTYLFMHCGNPLLGDAWEHYHLTPFSVRSRELEMKIKAHLANGHEQKLAKVVEAIGVHNPDAAERWMREYVEEITEAIRDVISEE